ncbi:MAG: glycosyltransferase family 9 protein, partial [Rhodospirillaceae bacterium]|nr:glycosyltransferase family 9 protein [Rhodospirillaceae bacterium]
TRIGDAVISSGILGHLLETNPGAQVTVVCGPLAKDLFEGLPGLERIIVLEKKPFSLHWLEMWKQCIGHIWDVVVDLRNAPLSALLLSKRQYHLGRIAKNNTHRVVTVASLLGLEKNPPGPRLWPRASDTNDAAKLIPDARPDAMPDVRPDVSPDNSPVLGLGPSANWIGKVWPADNFITLAARLVADDGIIPRGRIAVFAHESEREMVTPIMEALKDKGCAVIDLVGSRHLLTVYSALKRCSFYVGNDSGLMHMAAASGVPTLGLFGPSREDHYAPWGDNCAYVRTDASYDDIFPSKDEIFKVGSLMGTLDVDKVERKARELWQSKGQ